MRGGQTTTPLTTKKLNAKEEYRLSTQGSDVYEIVITVPELLLVNDSLEIKYLIFRNVNIQVFYVLEGGEVICDGVNENVLLDSFGSSLFYKDYTSFSFRYLVLFYKIHPKITQIYFTITLNEKNDCKISKLDVKFYKITVSDSIIKKPEVLLAKRYYELYPSTLAHRNYITSSSSFLTELKRRYTNFLETQFQIPLSSSSSCCSLPLFNLSKSEPATAVVAPIVTLQNKFILCPNTWKIQYSNFGLSLFQKTQIFKRLENRLNIDYSSFCREVSLEKQDSLNKGILQGNSSLHSESFTSLLPIPFNFTSLQSFELVVIEVSALNHNTCRKVEYEWKQYIQVNKDIWMMCDSDPFIFDHQFLFLISKKNNGGDDDHQNNDNNIEYGYFKDNLKQSLTISKSENVILIADFFKYRTPFVNNPLLFVYLPNDCKTWNLNEIELQKFKTLGKNEEIVNTIKQLAYPSLPQFLTLNFTVLNFLQNPNHWNIYGRLISIHNPETESNNNNNVNNNNDKQNKVSIEIGKQVIVDLSPFTNLNELEYEIMITSNDNNNHQLRGGVFKLSLVANPVDEQLNAEFKIFNSSQQVLDTLTISFLIQTNYCQL